MEQSHDNIEMSIHEINSRIKEEVCQKTLDKLTDERLMDVYKDCPSVKKRINEVEMILDKNNINEETKQNILNELLLKQIPPGTKGVIRGNEFNKIVKEEITKYQLDSERFVVRFEEKYEKLPTTEIPDWYIMDKSTGKIIIGMNQLDLWGGGQQLNRGSKYIIQNNYNTKNSKLLCVVCNRKEFRSNKNKAFNLFNIGFKNDTLCYLNNLQNIIYSYFNLK